MKLLQLLLTLGLPGLFAAMLEKALMKSSWSADVVELLAGFGGLVVFLFPYEASLFLGYSGIVPLSGEWHVVKLTAAEAVRALQAGKCQ